jgi:hypothetical protein
MGREFQKRDSNLLDATAHEQAISHRIAVYLEHFFLWRPGLNVDCEYNKHLDASKTGEFDVDYFKAMRSKFSECECWSCMHPAFEKFPEKLFRPDILVHSRGNDDANLIVIEVKRDVVCPFDLTKLKALTTPKASGGRFGYALGLFLHFPGGDAAYEWFRVS